jgi:hypothetical protein
MSSHSWTDVWKVFLDVVSHETIVMQIAIVLGAAFAAVMTLEGIRASFFPKRIADAVTLRNAVPAPQPALAPAPAPQTTLSAVPVPQEDMRAAWVAPPEPVAYTPPRAMVNAEYARRSSPRRMRVIGQRKPS